MIDDSGKGQQEKERERTKKKNRKKIKRNGEDIMHLKTKEFENKVDKKVSGALSLRENT